MGQKGRRTGFDGNSRKGAQAPYCCRCHGISVGVSAANVADIKAASAVLVWVLEMYERIAKVLADQGYRGHLGNQEKMFDRQGRLLFVKEKGFPQPKRWIAERTST